MKTQQNNREKDDGEMQTPPNANKRTNRGEVIDKIFFEKKL